MSLAGASVVVLLAFLLGVLSAGVAADIAFDRGRSRWGWAFAGLVAPGLAPVLVWLSPPNPRVWDRCEHCSEHIRPTATVCPHCTRSAEGLRNVGRSVTVR